MFLFILLIFYLLIENVSQDSIVLILTNLSLVILIVYSLYIIGNKKRLLIIAYGLLGCSVIILYISEQFQILSFHFHTVGITLSFLFFFLMMTSCLRSTLEDEKISITTLFGAICSYLFIGLAWSYLYSLIYHFNGAAFQVSNLFQTKVESLFIYYSFVTLTTLGYGDIAPVSNLARTLSYIEAVIGQIYVAILLAHLIGLYNIRKR